MEDPADGVVEDLGGGEGLVTTLMSHDPEASSGQTLDEGVQSPQDKRTRSAIGRAGISEPPGIIVDTVRNDTVVS